ncbi:unnamed protein product [Rodentolepis nana]|uniref:DUF5734 domain-containing protein n=1 Tax=Rodentolepis nana TaxID=102285 RepID=A0A0R3TMX5_RODNA|nr:unnamed protein product [Rodentolepis nana]
MSKQEKKGKEKKVKEPPLQVKCPLVKDYAIGKAPKIAEIEAMVSEAEGEKQPFTGTAAKGKVSLKSAVKGKKPPKINFKNVKEARQLSNDNTMVALTSETKKGGNLIMLKCMTGEEAIKFLQLVKAKNQNVKVVKASNKTTNFAEATVAQAPTDTKEPVVTEITAPGPTSPTALVTVTTGDKNNEPSVGSPNYSLEPKRLDSTTSGYIHTYTTRATSPQFDLTSMPSTTLNTVGEVFSVPPLFEDNGDANLSLPPKQSNLQSRSERHRPVPLTDPSYNKSKSRDLRGFASSSSSSASSNDRRHDQKKNQNMRPSIYSLSTSSSSSEANKRSPKSSRIFVQNSRPSYSSSSSSYSSSRGRVSTKYSNKQYNGNNVEAGAVVPTRSLAKRSQSVDLSNFSLMRISTSTRSITNLYSFGVPLPYSTKTSFSHGVYPGSSESSILDEDGTRSDFSYAGSDASDGSFRTGSKHSSYHSNRCKSDQYPSLKVM